MPITVENLRYVYNPGSPFEKVALDDVSLTIEDGDFFGVIGHTGSGKSTLVSHFNALTRLQSGKITIDDIVLAGKLDQSGKKKKRRDREKKKPDFRALRAKVGMVFQYPEYQLFDETVVKDVMFGPKNLGLPKEELEQRAREAVEMVGLSYDAVKDRSPFDLSGGQKRRVALAGVLAMRPKILILDEPTAGLDPRGKREVLDLIVKIKREACPTIVMISHNMDEVAEYCNKIAVMSNGRLACVLPPEQLFSQADLLAELHIRMPMVTQIACALADRGLDVPRGIVTEQALVAAILRARKPSAPEPTQTDKDEKQQA